MNSIVKTVYCKEVMKRKSVRIDRKEFDNAEICDPESN